MFLQTLALGEWCTYSWIQETPTAVDEPLLVKKKKTDSNHAVTEFLMQLPKMESHYCRSHTSKLYLEPVWQSINDLYRFYVKNCSENGKRHLSHTSFRAEFNKLNLALFTPK